MTGSVEGTSGVDVRRQVRLDDGRHVWCTSPGEAQVLWREMSSQGFYRRAAGRLRPDDLVLDVGANIGLAALVFADVQPAAELIAVEPAPETFACLRDNLDRHVPRGTAVQAAVAAASGTLPFVYYPAAPGNSSLYADQEADDTLTRTFLRNTGLDDESIELMVDGLHDGTPMEVSVTTVSDLLRERGTRPVGLLKIDVERAELDVLRGIEAADWRRIRNIVAEVHDENDGLDVFCRTLREHGFVAEVRQDANLRNTGLYEVDATRPAD
ncbi:FkbM family methyltransferase [Embleya sp. NBC_00896]|uniref:FkbM family methyltransferase n=1 Tax=Embleya sp. NBC_00896 TaxID=2975961 RepID=UPI003863D91D|nr:FkbM family methyltransferase [Embleya sp. NBC_00896]